MKHNAKRRFTMKTFVRRSSVVALALTFLTIGLFATGHAADFPKRSITILCHSSPGSPVDLMARQMAESAGKILGVPLTVETKRGGSGAVAMSYLLSQKADGYTVYAMTRSNTDAFASGKIKDFTWKELAYIIRVQTDPFVIAAHPSAPFKTAKGMIAYCKKNPGKVKVGGYGHYSTHHIMAIKFAMKAGIKITWVPYPGGAKALAAALGGHVPVVHTNPGKIVKHVQARNLVPLATSGGKRISALPGMPTYKEMGINLEDYHFRGVATKNGVPKDRIKILHNAFKKAMKTSAFKEYTKKNYLLPGYMNSEDFTKLFGGLVESNKRAQKELGL
jgi:tripartite-type tricarboxylate transporter receptor subunit TctC